MSPIDREVPVTNQISDVLPAGVVEAATKAIWDSVYDHESWASASARGDEKCEQFRSRGLAAAIAVHEKDKAALVSLIKAQKKPEVASAEGDHAWAYNMALDDAIHAISKSDNV